MIVEPTKDIDTLSWNIGLTNLEPDPNGIGKWGIEIIYGNPTNTTSPAISSETGISGSGGDGGESTAGAATYMLAA